MPAVSTDTAQRKRTAAGRAEQIRLGLQSTAYLYATAVTEEDWKTLGYASIRAWNAAEFGPDRFSIERRREIHALLTARGLTQRQIAAATGSGAGTVARDQQTNGMSHSAPDGAPATPRQQAARDREASHRQARTEDAGTDRPEQLRDTQVQDGGPSRPESRPQSARDTQSGHGGPVLDELAALLHRRMCSDAPQPCTRADVHVQHYRERAAAIIGRLEPEIGLAKIVIAADVILGELL